LEMRPHSDARLWFQFSADNRKELAKLKTNTRLTIEGQPRQGSQEKDERTVYFTGCKIVKTTADD
jgi:hypothetical protein